MKYPIVISLMVLAIFACKTKEEEVIQTYKVEGQQSKIEWKGSAPTHFHTGSFSVSGELHADSNGNIQDGRFTIPIASIQNYDLPDEVKPQLLDHLKSPDFFNVALHPDAIFEIVQVIPSANLSTDISHTIKGTFTMLGVSNPISIPAKVSSENGVITTKASFAINRLEWGMSSYNDPDAELYILPEVEIKLDIKATK